MTYISLFCGSKCNPSFLLRDIDSVLNLKSSPSFKFSSGKTPLRSSFRNCFLTKNLISYIRFLISSRSSEISWSRMKIGFHRLAYSSSMNPEQVRDNRCIPYPSSLDVQLSTRSNSWNILSLPLRGTRQRCTSAQR